MAPRVRAGTGVRHDPSGHERGGAGTLPGVARKRMHVVAEGVETEAQRHLLSRVHHCDTLQGFLFGKPMPAQAIEALPADVAPASPTMSAWRETTTPL